MAICKIHLSGGSAPATLKFLLGENLIKKCQGIQRRKGKQ